MHHSTASSNHHHHQPHHQPHVSQDPAGRSSKTPSLNAPAGKGILKKSSSASSNGYDQDSGMHGNANYSRDSDSSMGSAAPRYAGTGYRVEQLPDPIGARQSGKHGAGPIEHSSDTEGGVIPEPVRASRRTPRSTRAAHDNTAYRSDADDAPPPRVTPLQSDTSASAYGGASNSAYQSDDQQPYEPTPQPRSAEQVVRAPMQRPPFRPPVRAGMPVRPVRPGMPGMPRQPMRVPRPMHPGQPMMRPPMGAPGQRIPFRPPGGAMVRQPRPMHDPARINIHAQPGTSVHIAQNLGHDNSAETPI